MSAFLSPVLNEPQADSNGVPLSGGQIFTYLAGSSTPAATYTASDGLTPQANPIILNSRGVVANPIWLTSGTAYKFVLKDANGVIVNPGFDNVQGVNDPTSMAVADQWVSFGVTPTFVSTTSFALAGDQTNTFQAGRRIKAQCSGGVVYATIVSAVFTASTLVTISPDVLNLDAGLSAVSYSLLSATNDAIPRNAQRLLSVRRFTATGTYTPTAGTSAVVVELVGGGGAGGGCAATAAAQIAAAGGGSAGGHAKSRLTSGFAGVTITIGAAGAGVVGAGGGAGGTTSFGALLAATGGVGGNAGPISAVPAAVTAAAGTAGGVGSGGNMVNAAGGPGAYSIYAPAFALSGAGGSSFYGGGGASVFNTSAGQAASSPGAGGGGSSQAASSAANAGGAGGAGQCLVWEYA